MSVDGDGDVNVAVGDTGVDPVESSTATSPSPSPSPSTSNVNDNANVNVNVKGPIYRSAAAPRFPGAQLLRRLLWSLRLVRRRVGAAAGLLRPPVSRLVPPLLPAGRRHLRAALQLVPERIVLPRHVGALHRLAGELLDAAQEVVLLRRGEAGGAPAR